MPEIITCPDCGRKLRVPDSLVGKTVKCPDCNVKFTGGISSSPNGSSASKAPVKSAAVKRKPDDEDDRPSRRQTRDEDDDRPSKRRDRDDDDDRPSKRRARDDEDEDHPRRRRSEYDDDDDRDDYRRGPSKADKRAGWKMTLTGLNLLCYAIYVLLGTLAVFLLGCSVLALVGAAGVSSGNMNTAGSSMIGVGIGAILLYALYGLGMLAYTVLQATGHGFCMAIPPKPGSPRKAMAIATFSCYAGMIVLYLLSCGVNYGLAGRGAGVVVLLPMVVFLGYFICYGIFMRGVAQDMREPGLAAQVLYFMIAVPCLFVLGIIMWVVMFIVMGAVMFGAATSSTGSGAASSLGAGFIFMMGCGILFLCVEIGMLIWYIILVHQVRNAVRNYVG